MNTLKNPLSSSGILTITLNRPDKLNALNHEVLTELENLFVETQHDSNVKGIIITGEGKAFCAGADINRLAELNSQQGYEFAIIGQRVFRLLETLGKPSLAAINGYAFGGGCELAMAASMRIASLNACFAQPEVKLGVIPGYGGTQRLARLVGKGRAIDLCITGRTINADTALQWGLISEVTDPAQLLARANIIMEGILSMGPLAIKSVLEVIDTGYDLPLENALHQEATQFGLLCGTHDHQEGVHAFLEKRKACFKGC